ncbi:mannitol dehydrogenase family protein [Kineococcus aurantiacus]|uniref:mannitol dehydrogenase family protein n=1 Tax=Kineococcus aurantiacus TaxID=37633 RepID=UPI0031DD66F4
MSDVSSLARTPDYDRAGVRTGIVHIGVGAFHRAHQAVYLDDLLAIDDAAKEFGLIGVNLLPSDTAFSATLRRQDGLYTVLERRNDGSTEARIIGSIIEVLHSDTSSADADAAGAGNAAAGTEAVLGTLTDPGIRIVTLTITEGGYCYDAATRQVNLDDPGLRADITSPQHPSTAFGFLAEALRRRQQAGVAPFTVLSCDNVHANGELTRTVLSAVASAQDPEFGQWVAQTVAFPNSMVDRITPRTSQTDVRDAAFLTGLRDAVPVACEPFRQWVLEDSFPTGRPAWEKVGVSLVKDVRPYELMKMRLLNAGHQTIAYAGRLRGHLTGWQACTEPAVEALLRTYQAQAESTLTPIPGVDFAEYSATVRQRFANPQISDTMERLCAQSSTMLATFVLPVIRDLLRAGQDAAAAIAVVACWARFLEGTTEDGDPLSIVDTRSEDLRTRAARHDIDLLAVIRDNPMFTGLEDDASFIGTYQRLLQSIRQRGLTQALLEHGVITLP